MRGPGGSLLREHDLPVHALVEQRGVRSQGVFGIGLKIDVLSPHVVLKVMDLRDSLGNPAPADTVCVSDVLLAVDGKSVENVRQRPATQRAQPLVLCPVSLSFGPCSRRVARCVSCVCLAEGCVGPGELHSRPERQLRALGPVLCYNEPDLWCVMASTQAHLCISVCVRARVHPRIDVCTHALTRTRDIVIQFSNLAHDAINTEVVARRHVPIRIWEEITLERKIRPELIGARDSLQMFRSVQSAMF